MAQEEKRRARPKTDIDTSLQNASIYQIDDYGKAMFGDYTATAMSQSVVSDSDLDIWETLLAFREPLCFGRLPDIHTTIAYWRKTQYLMHDLESRTVLEMSIRRRLLEEGDDE
jgi:hypothetical protein